MPASIRDYINDLKQFQLDINRIVKFAVIGNQGKILQVHKLRLFHYGIDGSGKVFGQYHEQTIERKKKKLQRTKFVTLRDTGELYKSMYVYYENGYLWIESDSYKYPMMIDKYGDDITELTAQELEEVVIQQIVDPEVQYYLDRLSKGLR